MTYLMRHDLYQSCRIINSGVDCSLCCYPKTTQCLSSSSPCPNETVPRVMSKVDAPEGGVWLNIKVTAEQFPVMSLAASQFSNAVLIACL